MVPSPKDVYTTYFEATLDLNSRSEIYFLLNENALRYLDKDYLFSTNEDVWYRFP